MQRFESISAQNRYWAHVQNAHFVAIHWHKFYEIELIVEGTGTQTLNSIETSLRPGALTLVSPTDFHRLESNTSSSFRILNMCVVPDVLPEEMVSFFRQYPPPYFLNLDADEMEEFSKDYYEIKKMADSDINVLTDAIIRRKIELFILKIIARAVKTPLQPPNDTQQQLYTFFQPILNYINEHYHEPLRRDQLANMVHMSPSYFGDQFKKCFGISLFDYITDTRLRKAYSLLKHTDESVHNIVTMVGFNSPSLFYRKFYEYYKKKPLDVAKKKDQTS
jgi:AraC-like DNA-binding protein